MCQERCDDRCVVDSSDKFAGCINDAGGHFTTIVIYTGNTPLYSLKYLRKWIQNGALGIIRGPGVENSWKKSGAKKLVSLSL